jgi:hypothetical protein
MTFNGTTDKSGSVMGFVRLPGRLTAEETARLLGFAGHDIPTLVKARLLPPLGDPPPNSPKFFAACEVEKFAGDRRWLDRATRAVAKHWREKNERRPRETAPPPNEAA